MTKSSPDSPSPSSAAYPPALEPYRRSGELMRVLREIYDQIDAACAERSAACRGDGECCHFDTAGHRLYVSPGELAMLLQTSPPVPPPWPVLRCPYQVGTSCCARESRPLGCRTYFCDTGLADWSCQTYERHHARIRHLHEQLGLPYFYRELTAALAELTSP